MMNLKLFSKKEKTEIENKTNRLKKIINKKDEILFQESIELLTELTENKQNILADNINKLSVKHNKYLDSLSFRILRMDTDLFTEEVIQSIIDYCFRYGDTEIQKNGVLILKKYNTNKNLLLRYQFIFLKNKLADNLLRDIYSYCKIE